MSSVCGRDDGLGEAAFETSHEQDNDEMTVGVGLRYGARDVEASA